MEDIESTFSHAIVREPGSTLIHGLTSAALGKPDFKKALHQHEAYIKTLERCGLSVTVLPARDQFPDATFIEDTAVIAPPAAILTRPGAFSRQGEETIIKPVLEPLFTEIYHISSPGTLEGGDVLRVQNHFYVGISARTNRRGFEQFNQIVIKFGYSASAIPLERVLHLKTGLSYLGRNCMIMAGEFLNHTDFSTYKPIPIKDEESYAANSIRINDYVLVPAGFPITLRAIEGAGFSTLSVDVSEFQKLDGGLSCLSLRC